MSTAEIRTTDPQELVDEAVMRHAFYEPLDPEVLRELTSGQTAYRGIRRIHGIIDDKTLANCSATMTTSHEIRPRRLRRALPGYSAPFFSPNALPLLPFLCFITSPGQEHPHTRAGLLDFETGFCNSQIANHQGSKMLQGVGPPWFSCLT